MDTRFVASARQERMLNCILILAFISFFIFIGLSLFYACTLSTVPSKATGNIYPLNVHGYIVYLNSSQNHWFKTFGALSFLFGAMFASTAAIMLYFHRKRRRRPC